MKKVLILGAGISGAATAQRLSGDTIQIHLVEKSEHIGGHALEMGCKASDTCARCNVCVANDLFKKLADNSLIKTYLSTELTQLLPGKNGGRFSAQLSKLPSKSGSKPIRLDIDALVIATGHEPFNPRENSSYNYRRLPNVITGMEAEKQLKEKSLITRPSDNAAPRRVAFVQCVGSRTEEVFRSPDNTDYCSRVCCGYALRMARFIKHRKPESEVTVFYMDIQNFGKNFNAFLNSCKEKIKFIRSRPSEILPGKGDSVLVKFAADGAASPQNTALSQEEFDLVVLSTGIRPAPQNRALAELLGVPLDGDGFFGLKGAAALPDLQKKNIYVVGTSEGPKDIAGCMVQAGAVSNLIASAQYL
ncbi:MAG: NAD(P)-binding protein [Chitinivibrionales bacterium]|nr:NAD(P)-binding protein [Chitinivibrionales bacterium]